MADENLIILDTDFDKFDALVGKYPAEDYYKVEVIAPASEADKSITFPIKIVSECAWKGLESKLSPGKSEGAMSILKGVLSAFGIPYQEVKTPRGKKPAFNPVAAVGKVAEVKWVEYVTNTGNKATKPESTTIRAVSDVTDLGV